MSNSYQEKFNELESGSAAIKKKLEGGINLKSKVIFNPAVISQKLLEKL